MSFHLQLRRWSAGSCERWHDRIYFFTLLLIVQSHKLNAEVDVKQVLPKKREKERN
jgi:hypothetical protein